MNISCAENIYMWDKFKARYPKFEVAGVTIQQASGVIEYYEPEHTSKMGMDDASIREHEEVTKVKASLFRYHHS